jgi:hypothetical protein
MKMDYAKLVEKVAQMVVAEAIKEAEIQESDVESMVYLILEGFAQDVSDRAMTDVMDLPAVN